MPAKSVTAVAKETNYKFVNILNGCNIIINPPSEASQSPAKHLDQLEQISKFAQEQLTKPNDS